MREEVENIKPDLIDESLDDELYKIKRKFDLEIKEQNLRLIEELNNGILNQTEYEARFSKQMKKVNAANGATLAESLQIHDDSRYIQQFYKLSLMLY